MAWLGPVWFESRGRVVQDPAPPSAARGDIKKVPQCNGRGDVCVAQALPERTALVAQRRSYYSLYTSGQTASSLPSTSSAGSLVLWNSARIGSKWCLVVDSLAAVNTVSCHNSGFLVSIGNHGTSAWTATDQFAQQVGTRLLCPTKDSNTDAASSYFNAGAASIRTHALGIAFWPQAGNSGGSNFQAIRHSVNATGTGVMMCMDADVYGRFVLPPDAWLMFWCTNDNGVSITMQYTIRWHEMQLELG